MILLALSATVLAAAACASPQPAPDAGAPDADAAGGEVTGTLTYRERIALPPGAEVTVRLVDVSLADAPWTVLDEQTIRTEGRQPPFPFTLRYDPAEVDARRRYAVHAEIREGDRLVFTTADSYPVDLVAGEPAPVDLVLERVASVGPAPEASVETPWEDARRRGVDFRATGNEPGWLLEVTEGERIVLETNYGSERHTFGAPGARMDWTSDHTFLRAAAEDGRTLEVELERRSCQDTMSGESFPVAVTVRWDGAELRGCGRVLA